MVDECIDAILVGRAAAKRAYEALTNLKLDRALGRLADADVAEVSRRLPGFRWDLDVAQKAEVHACKVLGLLSAAEIAAVERLFPHWIWKTEWDHLDAVKRWIEQDRGMPSQTAIHDGIAIGMFAWYATGSAL